MKQGECFTYIHVVEVVLVLLRALEVGAEGVLVDLGALPQVHALKDIARVIKSIFEFERFLYEVVKMVK